MPVADPGRVRVAHHEAGHVVAALAAGARVLSAAVWGDDPEGATDYETDRAAPDFLEQQLRIHLAGTLAGRRASPGPLWLGCREDLQRALALATALVPGGADPVALLRSQLASMDAWLGEPDRWAAVQAVAAALLAHGVLDRAALLSLLTHGEPGA